MHSDFLDKFQGKTSKISKDGYDTLFHTQSKKPAKTHKLKIDKQKQGSGEVQKKKKKKKSNNNLENKQNKLTKKASKSESQLKDFKNVRNVDQIHHPRIKQLHKGAVISKEVLKSTLKLPSIIKSKHNYQSQSIRQNRNTDNLIVKAKGKYINTESTEEKKDRGSFNSFLDKQASLQLKKMDEFERILLKKELKRNSNFDQSIALNDRVDQGGKKGATIHY